MTPVSTESREEGHARPVVPPLLRVGLWAIVGGILLQAALAGQALAGAPQLFTLHGGTGHGVLLLAALVATFAWLTGVPRSVAILASLVALGLVAQTGLGYAGHRSQVAVATALHVPLGVSLLGLAVAAAVLAGVPGRRTSGRPRPGGERDRASARESN